jgi:hypothetical protein
MTPENQVKKACLDWLAANRIFAFRLNSASMLIAHRMFSCHSLGPGASDILAFVTDPHSPNYPNSFSIWWLECKAGKNSQSPEQKSFQQFVESKGHRYILARSSDDLKVML